MDKSAVQRQWESDHLARFASPKFGVVGRLVRVPTVNETPVIQFGCRARQVTSWSDLTFPCGGASRIPHDAALAAIAEALERSASCHIDKRRVVRSSYNDLLTRGVELIDPKHFQLFSEAQLSLNNFGLLAFDPNREYDWIEGKWIHSQEPTFVPIDWVHLTKISQLDCSTTNGLAVGWSRESALVSGLYEVIERDAFLTAWWTRKSGRKVIVPRGKDNDLDQLLNLVCDDQKLLLVDISDEIGIPVFMSVFRGDLPSESSIAIAAACNWSPLKTARKTLSEIHQVYAWLRRNPEVWNRRKFTTNYDDEIRDFSDGVYFHAQTAARASHEFLWSTSESIQLFDLPEPQILSKDQELDKIVSRLNEKGFFPIEIDLTTNDLLENELRLFRSIVPGLVRINSFHKYRYWGTERLIQKAEGQPFNPTPHPFP